jgi:hypothetical protein
MERCFGLWGFDFVTRTDPSRLSQTLGVSDPILDAVLRLGPLGRPIMRMDELFYLRAMERQLDRARQRDRQVAMKQAEAEPSFPWYAPMSRIGLPAAEKVRDRRDETLARLALARWGLALCVYHQRAGQYPSSLAEVEQAAGVSLPADPLGGTEPVYHSEGNGYLLYSVGLNGRDEGGQSWRDHLRRGSPSPLPDPDDLAWRFATAGDPR